MECGDLRQIRLDAGMWGVSTSEQIKSNVQEETNFKNEWHLP